MSEDELNHNHDASNQVPPIARAAGQDVPQQYADVTSLDWQDGTGRMWTVELWPDRIVFKRDDAVIELSEDRWQRDLYLAQGASGFIVRVQTFDQEVGFLLSKEMVEPFVRHLGQRIATREQVVRAEQERMAREQPVDQPALAWPRISRYAVWALICASLVFLPVIGPILTIPTLILLALHRKYVRNIRATTHSRQICRIALLWMFFGLAVSVLATIGLMTQAGKLLSEPAAFSTNSSIDQSRATPGIGSQQLSSTAEESHKIATQSAPHPLAQFDSLANINWSLVAMVLFVILVSLSVHECAHAISAWWLGDDFARRDGRVTLNPLAHIDPFGTVILPLILYLAGGAVFGFAKPVPVRTDMLRNPRRDDILVSIAGPGSNLLLASISFSLLLALCTLVGLIYPQAEVSGLLNVFGGGIKAEGFSWAQFFVGLATLLQFGFAANLFLAGFNMIPIPPLDGSHVLARWFPQSIGRLYDQIRPFSFIIFIFLIYTDLFFYFMIPIMSVFASALFLLSLCSGVGI